MKQILHKLFILLLLLSTFWGLQARGQGNAEIAPAQSPDFEVPSLWITSLQMLFWLLIVIVLIFISVWLIRKVMQQGKQFNAQKPVSLLFQETIGPGRSICLVRVLDQIHVIGVTNTQISYLATLEDDEIDMVDQRLEDELILEDRLKSGFQSFFQRLARKAEK